MNPRNRARARKGKATKSSPQSKSPAASRLFPPIPLLAGCDQAGKIKRKLRRVMVHFINGRLYTGDQV